MSLKNIVSARTGFLFLSDFDKLVDSIEMIKGKEMSESEEECY